MAVLLFSVFVLLAGALATWLLRRAPAGGRRPLTGAMLGVLALPAFLASAVLAARMANDWRLARFARQVDRHPLPAGARLLARADSVGVLTGNGDHCDFVVRRRIGTTLPLEAVRAHYGSLQLAPAIAGGASGGLPALAVEPLGPGEYEVVAVDAPYDGPTLDWRCV